MKRTVISFLIFALSITLAFLLTACAEKEETQPTPVPECQHAYVKETTPPTCTENGLDTFTCAKCDYCYTIQINATGHSPKAAVEENRVEATCTTDGNYDSVVYCGSCDIELSKETITIPANGHSPKAAVEENRVEPTCTALGHYDTVVYCDTCDAELSRNTVTLTAPGHTPLNGVCTKCGKLFPSNGLTYTLNPDGKSYTVTGIGSFTGKNLVIDQYNGLPVTSIGSWAFRDCTSLTSVTIGNSVTSIGEVAFYGCSRLPSITIPDSVTSIGDYAFYSCGSLTIITIPDSVTSIGNYAFEYCDSLTSITVDASNQSYKSVDGNLYTKDGKTLIQYAIGKSETSFTIPDSVTSIGNYAFYGCSSLTSITIPDSVTSIGTYAFYACSGLKSIKYRGTEEKWDAISKGYDWDYGTGDYTITYNYTGN